MRRRRAVASAVGAAAVWGAAALAVPGAAGAWTVQAARGAVPAASSWGRAIAVPGLRALNEGRHAVVRSVSCGPAGNCAAGGSYRDRNGHGQGFVVTEKNGPLEPGDQGARPGNLEQGRAVPRHLGVVWPGGQLRGRRLLP